MIEEEASQEESKEESGLTAIARIRELELQLEKVSAEAENNKVATSSSWCAPALLGRVEYPWPDVTL